jgi:stress response protein SCP2
MIVMQRGSKSKLDAGNIEVEQPIQIKTKIVGKSQYDFSCFVLDQSDKVPDERYVIFFNQLTSPNGEISLETNENDSVFQVNLDSLPSHLKKKLSFAITTDGKSSMRDIKTCTVQLIQNEQIAFSLEITGKDFQNQKAIITIEIYNRNGWRVGAVANGFNFSGGLDELMAYYGVDVRGDSKPIPPSPNPIPRQEKQSNTPIRNASRESSQQQPVVDNESATGKNAEGFDRNDNDWV